MTAASHCKPVWDLSLVERVHRWLPALGSDVTLVAKSETMISIHFHHPEVWQQIPVNSLLRWPGGGLFWADDLGKVDGFTVRAALDKQNWLNALANAKLCKRNEPAKLAAWEKWQWRGFKPSPELHPVPPLGVGGVDMGGDRSAIRLAGSPQRSECRCSIIVCRGALTTSGSSRAAAWRASLQAKRTPTYE
jgi:hypothetical protein